VLFSSKAYLGRMPEPAYPMRVILNIFMSDHDTGILPLQMHANRKEKKRKEKKRIRLSSSI